MAKRSLVTTIGSALATIAGKSQRAVTAADHASVVADLQHQIETETERYRQMEARRPTLVLDGGDIDAFTRDLGMAGERLLTLQASLSTAIARQQAAEDGERMLGLETRAEETRKLHLAKLDPARQAYLDALAEVRRCAEKIAEHEDRIMDMNHEVAGVRDDLVVDLSGHRQRFTERLASVDIGPRPEPTPLPDEADFRKRFSMIPRETKETYTARVDAAWSETVRKIGEENSRELQNYEHRLVRALELHGDKLKVDGDTTAMAIEAQSFPMGAHERYRNRRRIAIQSFSPAGPRAPSRRITATDGVLGPSRVPPRPIDQSITNPGG